MSRKLDRLENPIQRDIELDLGALPDLLLLRNNVGRAVFVNESDARQYSVPYGLGTGSPDLVGILGPEGRFFCLEVKAPGEVPRPEQEKCHRTWRNFGAFVATVDSVGSARAALERARAGWGK